MIIVSPGAVAGRLRAPASKSHLQRLLLAASQAPGPSVLRNPGASADGVACLGVIRALGAQVEEAPGRLVVQGGGTPQTTTLDCGESGFCLRAAAAVAALESRPMTLTGHGSLLARPMDMVLDPLRQLGASCSTGRDGLPPLVVCGPLRGGHARVDGRASSQFLSGLLLALPRAPRDTTLEVEGLRSGPYIRMTLDVLAAFGVRVEASPGLDHFRVPGGQRLRPVNLDVEGDWSGAAFLLVAGAVAGEVLVEGLNRVSSQADRAILEALEAAGAAPRWTAAGLHVERTDLRGFEFDATDCPDLFPPLAALACHAHGRTRIHGTSRLKVKESDRATALVTELSAMGATLRVEGDVLEIEGGPLTGGTVDPHNDHRIAMACAVAGLHSRDGASMEGESCVEKSYPEFFRDLASLRGGA
jgi:3-phosphoshikimate 1-carboxyvinyltransferase